MIVACATVLVAAPFAGVAAPDADARLTVPHAATTATAPPTPAAVTTIADRTGGDSGDAATLSRVGLGAAAAALVVSVAALVIALRRIAPR